MCFTDSDGSFLIFASKWLEYTEYYEGLLNEEDILEASQTENEEQEFINFS